MPIYEYICESCGKYQEIMQKYTDAPLTKCPACNGPMRKLISNTSFVLKGTGWYKTDYASSGSQRTPGKQKGNGAKQESKSEKKPETASKTE